MSHSISFQAKIIEYKNNLYKFEILDTISFELNKEYVIENKKPIFYFVKNNKRVIITMFGHLQVNAYKRNMCFYNICYRFHLSEPYFKIDNLKDTLNIDDIIFIQSNLPSTYLPI